jgi:Holliday junction resolvase RusA-like endonuclease
MRKARRAAAVSPAEYSRMLEAVNPFLFASGLVVCHPIAASRPKKGVFGMYDPDSEAKAVLKLRIVEALGGRTLQPVPLGEVRLRLVYRISVPVSFDQEERSLALAGLILPEAKPDVDNMDKIFMDSATGVLWGDDSAVVKNDSEQVYSDCPSTEFSMFYRVMPYREALAEIRRRIAGEQKNLH